MTRRCPAAGQGDDEDGSLAALCEANEAMRDTCLHLVATVLATAKAPTPWEEFETRMTDVLAPYSASSIPIKGIELELVSMSELRQGNWRPRDPETGRNLEPSKKKQVKPHSSPSAASQHGTWTWRRPRPRARRFCHQPTRFSLPVRLA